MCVRLLAEEVRGWLSYLGVRSLDEIVGRTDLLEQLEVSPREGVNVDLSRLLAPAAYDGNHCAAPRLYDSEDNLAAQLDGGSGVPGARRPRATPPVGHGRGASGATETGGPRSGRVVGEVAGVGASSDPTL